MTKGNKGKNKANSNAKSKDHIERKRDERARRNALRKEREAKEYLENDGNFVSFSNQLEALGYKIKDIKGDGLDSMSFIVNICKHLNINDTIVFIEFGIICRFVAEQ
jgi:hypothetical protein